jgi:hypothetical protein
LRIDTGAGSCHAGDMVTQPEKRLLIAWTVLAALVVMIVIAINLVVRVQAI